MPKKLIETIMPVAVINREAEREKRTRGGLPANVHIWWSRRSMAAARSTIFAACVDDPAEHPERFPSEAEQVAERNRLLAMTEALSVVESVSNKELLAAARKEVLRYADGTLPTVFDPFVGSGTVPVEAQRLGLKAVSSDLNPVAVMITKLVADIPARFPDIAPVHPQEALGLCTLHSGMEGFAGDVRYYGAWMLATAKERIGHLYPKVISPESGKKTEVSAWIWARTVKCPNPSCSCEIPLSYSYHLARKNGRKAWVEPYIDGSRVRFRVHREPDVPSREQPKVALTAAFKCPVCGEITPDAYVKECGVSYRIHSQLIAIVADEGKRRLYLAASPEQEAAANIPAPAKVPHGTLPVYTRRFSPPSFGLTDYADLFSHRQLTFLTTMMQLAREVQDDVARCAANKGMPNDRIPFAAGGKGALAYAEAVRMALVLTVSKLLDRCSNLCSWDSSGGGALRSVFSRAAMPMIWDYAESNPFLSASGSFANSLARICEAIASFPVGTSSSTTVHDGTRPNAIRDAMLCTEPPFYDKASYADLSDFFYVWLRYGLGDLFPDYFQTEVSPKKEELTAFAYRWDGDKTQADAYYTEGLRLAMKNLYDNVTEAYPSTISFQYKRATAKDDGSLSEWETFVTAVADAGFSFTASWPLGRKYDTSIDLAEARGIPITVVLRKRPADAPQATRRNFVTIVKRELPDIVKHLSDKVDLMDLRLSVIGQALNVYTRFSKVLDADGTIMPPYMASRIIEGELDTILTTVYGKVDDKPNSEEEIIHGRES